MLIESWILVMIMLVIFLFGLIGIGGWIAEGEKNRKCEEEIKRLRYEIKIRDEKLSRIAKLFNIKVANEYNKEN